MLPPIFIFSTYFATCNINLKNKDVYNEIIDFFAYMILMNHYMPLQKIKFKFCDIDKNQEKDFFGNYKNLYKSLTKAIVILLIN